jgi:hypothetical protein
MKVEDRTERVDESALVGEARELDVVAVGHANRAVRRSEVEADTSHRGVLSANPRLDATLSSSGPEPTGAVVVLCRVVAIVQVGFLS